MAMRVMRQGERSSQRRPPTKQAQACRHGGRSLHVVHVLERWPAVQARQRRQTLSQHTQSSDIPTPRFAQALCPALHCLHSLAGPQDSNCCLSLVVWHANLIQGRLTAAAAAGSQGKLGGRFTVCKAARKAAAAAQATKDSASAAPGSARSSSQSRRVQVPTGAQSPGASSTCFGLPSARGCPKTLQTRTLPADTHASNKHGITQRRRATPPPTLAAVPCCEPRTAPETQPQPLTSVVLSVCSAFS